MIIENPFDKIYRELKEEIVSDIILDEQDAGSKVLGYTCNYIPEPLLNLEGLIPVRLRATQINGTPMADTYLSSVNCPYTRSLLECSLENRFDFLDGWIFAASCDHLRRLYDNLVYLNNPSFTHVVDLPHKTGKAQIEWYQSELQRLAKALQKNFKIDASERAIRKSISEYNRNVEYIQQISSLRKLSETFISGYDFHKMFVSVKSIPMKLANEKLQNYYDTLKNNNKIIKSKKRILLVGSQLDNPEFIREIESVGCNVIADRFCYGFLPDKGPLKEDGDVFFNLAEYYLRLNCCPRMMNDYPKRLNSIISIAEEYNVDGIILMTMKFCDMWGVESGNLVPDLREAGFPVLRLEREYTLSSHGQTRTRVQAFLESM